MLIINIQHAFSYGLSLLMSMLLFTCGQKNKLTYITSGARI